MLMGCASLVGTGNFYQPWSGANPNWDLEVQLVKLNLESLRIRLQLNGPFIILVLPTQGCFWCHEKSISGGTSLATKIHRDTSMNSNLPIIPIHPKVCKSWLVCVFCLPPFDIYFTIVLLVLHMNDWLHMILEKITMISGGGIEMRMQSNASQCQ